MGSLKLGMKSSLATTRYDPSIFLVEIFDRLDYSFADGRYAAIIPQHTFSISAFGRSWGTISTNVVPLLRRTNCVSTFLTRLK